MGFGTILEIFENMIDWLLKMSSNFNGNFGNKDDSNAYHQQNDMDGSDRISAISIPEEEMDEFRDAFDMFNKSHITDKELIKLMQVLGLTPPTEIEIVEYKEELKINSSIDFDQFCSIMKKRAETIQSEDNIVLRGGGIAALLVNLDSNPLSYISRVCVGQKNKEKETDIH